MGAKYQVAKVKQRLSPEVAFTFALTHHPANWLTPREDPEVQRFLRQQFPLILHGHEHQEWVEQDIDGRLVISAGAAYQSSCMANGYNFGQIDLDQRKGSIHLRQWDSAGGGWIERNVAGRTKHGVWPLPNLSWLPSPDEMEVRSPAPESIAGSETEIPDRVDPADHFSLKFCDHVLKEHDRLELFGCTIPAELKHHRISVAYVSLNLSREGEEDDTDDEPVTAYEQESITANGHAKHGQDLPLSASFEDVLGRVSGTTRRLIIRGPAGAGKSTLLRWCATQAADAMIQRLGGSKERPIVAAKSLRGGAGDPKSNNEEWRQKVPVLIRLRDCKEGAIPAAAEIPRLLAKHLPSPPQDWMINLLDAGSVIVLLDGVDEVHADHRPQLAEEISRLIKAYPKCTYVVTTRPGAVERGWLTQMAFEEARVEPMGRQDRAEFIDKWFESAALELHRYPRPGEDLQQTAMKLKAELEERPDVGRLARWPLLCAMVCAIFRERQEQLPDTPAELCEALCEMLLHRRERETPGLQQKLHFTQSWAELTFPQKKTLLAALAWSMLTSKMQSSIEIVEAKRIVANVLDTFPGRSKSEADEVLQALIERSGILRMRTDEHLDFLHNALKEYVAAGKAVEQSEAKLLVTFGADPSWQPVLLYALALGPEPFSSTVVGGLLARSPKERLKAIQLRRQGRPMTVSNKRELEAIRAEQFFLMRCRSAAKCLASALSDEIDSMGDNLFPPASMPEAEALAQVGARLFAHAGSPLLDPDWWANQSDTRIAVRGLRMLRLIGGARAKQVVRQITELNSSAWAGALVSEWMECIAEFQLPEVPRWPSIHNKRIWISSLRLRDLSALAGATEARELSISCPADNLRPLVTMSNLESLSLFYCPRVESLSGVPCGCLSEVNIYGCGCLEDFTTLGNAASLQKLSIIGCKGPSRVGFIRNLCHLSELELNGVGLDEVEYQRLFSMELSNLEKLGLCSSKELTRESLRYLAHAAFPNLKTLELSHQAKISDHGLKLLRNRRFQALRKLVLQGCESLESVDFLIEGKWSDLTELDLSDCAALTQINGVAAGSLEKLEVLGLEGCTGIKNLSMLCLGGLPSLKEVVVRGCDSNAVAKLRTEARSRMPGLILAD
jgi:hypothetical protein